MFNFAQNKEQKVLDFFRSADEETALDIVQVALLILSDRNILTKEQYLASVVACNKNFPFLTIFKEFKGVSYIRNCSDDELYELIAQTSRINPAKQE